MVIPWHKKTYRKEDIAHVEQDEDGVADQVEVVPVRCDNQNNGNEVMAQHLPVVLAALLDVDHEHLLEPETQLGENVELEKPAELAVGPGCPKVLEVQPCWRGVVKVLREKAVVSIYGGRNNNLRPWVMDVHTKPKDQNTTQYMTNQACSLNRVTSFFLRRPR